LPTTDCDPNVKWIGRGGRLPNLPNYHVSYHPHTERNYRPAVKSHSSGNSTRSEGRNRINSISRRIGLLGRYFYFHHARRRLLLVGAVHINGQIHGGVVIQRAYHRTAPPGSDRLLLTIIVVTLLRQPQVLPRPKAIKNPECCRAGSESCNGSAVCNGISAFVAPIMQEGASLQPPVTARSI
jgi:hypothetical protein